MRPKHVPNDTCTISHPFCFTGTCLGVQILIMDYIKCVENLISNIYNGQTNPKQFQISARHSCYSMLDVENKVQGLKRQRLSFRPPKPRELREALPKLDNYMYHVVTPCQVLRFASEFWNYRDL